MPVPIHPHDGREFYHLLGVTTAGDLVAWYVPARAGLTDAQVVYLWAVHQVELGHRASPEAALDTLVPGMRWVHRKNLDDLLEDWDSAIEIPAHVR
jgi:hypothetical protein